MKGIAAIAAWLLLACGDDGALAPVHDARPDDDAALEDAADAPTGDGGLDAPLPDAAIDAPGACIPRTCDAPNQGCGTLDDGCGGTLSCGTCPDALTCGAVQPGICGVPAATRTCNAAGWCWENPLPFGMDLNEVWAASPTDIWAVGEGGTLLRSDGTRWRSIASGTDVPLRTVWGPAANDVWLGGFSGYLRRWNGTRLEPVAGASPDFFTADLHGTGPTDVWLVGGDPSSVDALRHFDGASWTSHANPRFFSPEAVFAASPSAAWAFGFDDTALQWDGTSWSPIAALAQGAPHTDVWGASATDVYAASWDGLEHWDGSTWSPVAALTGTGVEAVHGTSATDVWASRGDDVHHFDGTTWQPFVLGLPLASLWSLTPDAAWGVGRGGAIAAWSGTRWTQQSGFGPTAPFVASCRVADDEVWFASDQIVRWRGGVIEALPAPFAIRALWGAAPDHVWAAGTDGQVAHWNGAAWTTTRILDVFWSPDIVQVWGTSPTDVWAVSEPESPFEPSEAHVFRFDGTTWRRVHSFVEGAGGEDPVPIGALGGRSSRDVWIATGGALWHWDGTQWTRGVTAHVLHDFWHSPQGTLWAAGFDAVYRHDGVAWTVATTGLHHEQITGTSDTDVWTTTLSNNPWNVVRLDGASWVVEPTGAGQAVRQIEATSGGLFVGGASGGILRKPR